MPPDRHWHLALPLTVDPYPAEFRASLSANGRRLAEATVTLEHVSTDPVILGRRPVINVRHFPRLSAGLHDRFPPAEVSTTIARRNRTGESVPLRTICCNR